MLIHIILIIIRLNRARKLVMHHFLIHTLDVVFYCFDSSADLRNICIDVNSDIIYRLVLIVNMIFHFQ
jgi:hypothetical protein